MDSSEAEELSGAYVLTVDELGNTGLWDSVKEVRSGLHAQKPAPSSSSSGCACASSALASAALLFDDKL